MDGIVPQDGQNESTIVVMGATGTGKSTFIKCVTGDERIAIGHNVISETVNVQGYRYQSPDLAIPVVLVDTPGFDDSREEVTDTDILEKLATFLQLEESQRLTGIIYMHRISDNRAGRLYKLNLRMFRALCGDRNMLNVRIVTSHWDRVSIDEGTRREAELIEGIFEPLIRGGARVVRFDQARRSALDIVSELMMKSPIKIQLMDEIEQEGRTLVQTSAGRIINDNINWVQRQHGEEMNELAREMEGADEKLRTKLAKDRDTLAEQVRRLEGDKTRLQDLHQKKLKLMALGIGAGLIIASVGIGVIPVASLASAFEMVESLSTAAACVAASLP